MRNANILTVENKHSIADLVQMQSLPLAQKITMTKRRIREWYEAFDGQVYVSWSGGKDSTVLKHIVDSIYDDVPSVFINTGLEYPEIQKFVREVRSGKYRELSSNVVIIRPDMPFAEVLSKYGYPVISKEISQIVREAKIGIERGDGSYSYRIDKLNGTAVDKNGKKSTYNCEKYKYLLDAPFNCSEQCCRIMKKRPAHSYERSSGRKPFIGTLASESSLRKSNWVRYGCNSFDTKRISSTPIAFWTEQDILQYILDNNIPIPSIYGEVVEDGSGKLNMSGIDRTGCIFCAFGCHRESEPNRFQMLKQTHPRQYEYCIGGGEFIDGVWKPSKDGLGLGKVLDYIGVHYK